MSSNPKNIVQEIRQKFELLLFLILQVERYPRAARVNEEGESTHHSENDACILLDIRETASLATTFLQSEGQESPLNSYHSSRSRKTA